MTPDQSSRALAGCLQGAAIGDAVGLCCEKVSARRQPKLFPDLNGPRFLGGRGMISDDTEHACLVAQSLIVSAGDPEKFQRDLARRLRWWLVGLPFGFGMATVKAILRLWVGFHPSRSGVHSAGNGPCMRSPLIGAAHGHDHRRLKQLVGISTRMTHTHKEAGHGALAAALAAHWSAKQMLHSNWQEEFTKHLGTLIAERDVPIVELAKRAASSATNGESTAAFARSLGLERGVSGYVNHTMPVVLHTWFRSPTNYREAVLEIVRCGGDTDTTAAILGAIIGAGVGVEGLPTDWRKALFEWPRSEPWMLSLAVRLAEVQRTGEPGNALPLSIPGLFARNLFFDSLVLVHGLRRLLPPY